MNLRSLLLLILFLVNISAYSQLVTPQILSSNMVLQQGQKVAVWGTAGPNERIQISFAGQHVKTRADSKGRWAAELQPMKASKISQPMTIKGSKSNLVYENILVGEVWLCAGQSNMEYTMKRYPDFLPSAKGEDLATAELAMPRNELIRVFNSTRKGQGTWEVADGKSLEKTSAVGYFFAKSIQQKLDVPMGIISAAIGGTQIEAWTTKEAYEKSAIFASAIKASGKVGGHGPGNWYDIMIEPLVPYTVKGFLWYQGENNCGKRDRQYAEKYKVLVNSWRETFNLEDAPFYFVLLAPHVYSDRLHNKKITAVTAEDLPLFWEQQIKSASLVANSDFVVITDLIDGLNDIHPPYKWEVGARLARLALAKTYGFKDVIWSGPRVREIRVAGDSIAVTFDYCAEGLTTNDGKRLSWFEVAAGDGVFRPAFAEVKGKETVMVFHPEIKRPVQVRLGWHETATPNLVNSLGLPAVPFGARQK